MHIGMYLVFQHCIIQTMILIFRTRRSQFVGSFRLHYLSVSRQVPTCMSYLINFIKVIAKYYDLSLHEKEKPIFEWCELLYIYIVGWQWNHGLMLWWRFHCTGKYISRINNPWPSNPCTVLKQQPTDSLWMGSAEVSSFVRISSADY